MKKIRAGLLAAVAAAAYPTAARAQSAPAHKASEPSCPCAENGFTPKTEKARAVQQYWQARRAYKIAGDLNGTIAIFALMAQDGRTVAAAQQSYDEAGEKMLTARQRAEELGGLTVKRGGGTVDTDVVTIKLIPGVDYEMKN
jgi:hypothetical protein